MKERGFIIGIDEAGRGPLAGPVSVGAVMVPRSFDINLLSGIKDSKQLLPHMRDAWYEKLLALQRQGDVRFSVSFASAQTIDRRGIVPAIRQALARCLKKLAAEPETCEILLDGSLYAPQSFTCQKTIIRGDSTVPLISLASIAAKVRRDRAMEKFATLYPVYDFQRHKGYATAGHRKVILAEGLCELHRATFCTNLIHGAIAL